MRCTDIGTLTTILSRRQSNKKASKQREQRAAIRTDLKGVGGTGTGTSEDGEAEESINRSTKFLFFINHKIHDARIRICISLMVHAVACAGKETM